MSAWEAKMLRRLFPSVVGLLLLMGCSRLTFREREDYLRLAEG